MTRLFRQAFAKPVLCRNGLVMVARPMGLVFDALRRDSGFWISESCSEGPKFAALAFHRLKQLVKQPTRLLARYVRAFVVSEFVNYNTRETVAGPLDLYVTVPPDQTEKAIRGFFEGRGHELLLESPYGPGGWQVLRFKLPYVAGPASELMRHLLEEAYQVLEHTRLQFIFGSQPGGLW